MFRMLCCLTIGLLCVGCSNEDTLRPQPIVHTPLALDPTENIELGEWWTNGKRLLRLHNDGRYEQFNSLNRYEMPEQRGRWSQGSYAVLWLEPYATQQQRLRVNISKAKGGLALEVPKLGMMYPLDNPPMVLEDQLVGSWDHALGTLRLARNMQFEYKHKWPSIDDALVGDMPRQHIPSTGRWRVVGETVELQPASPAEQPMMLDVQVQSSGITLTSTHGTFSRQSASRMTSEAGKN